MSQVIRMGNTGVFPPGSTVQTITGNDMIPVGPDPANNINLVTDNATLIFTGNPGTFTISLDFGLSNLVLGSDPSLTITTADQNVGLGLNALSSLTTGMSNVGVGVGALFNNDSGSDNVAIGASALLSNTTANQNVAIGTSALLNNNAIGNIAIGHQTLFSNTSGIGNIAIGPLALTANISGNNNIAIGLGNLFLNTGGISNIAIGSGVLVANTNDENIGIGQGSLSAVTTGFNNIAIGINAGNAYTTNESNNIVIGLTGVIGESDVTRIANIYGDAVGAVNSAVFIDNTGKLGTLGGSGGVVTSLRGNDGLIVMPTLGVIDVITDNATVKFLNTPVLSSTLELSFSDPLGRNDLALGSSLLSRTVGSQRNTALGINALNSLTSGNQNVAIGYNALSALTTGQANVVIGNDSATSLTTVPAISNIIIGSNAFSAATTAAVNIIIGSQAADNLIDGVRNLIIGDNAGNAYTGTETQNILLKHTGVVGESNTIRIATFPTQSICYLDPPLTINNGDLTLAATNAAGNINLQFATTALKGVIMVGGSRFLHNGGSTGTNAFLGGNAGNFTNTGLDNIGIGVGASDALTTGNENIAIGITAGNTITSGSRNTILGSGAGGQIDTGSDNIMIGELAGVALVTGSESDNIIIGSPGANNESGAIRIGTNLTHTTCYITGITDNSFVTPAAVVGIDIATNQLGIIGNAAVISGTGTTVGAVTDDVITYALGATPGCYSIDVRVAAFESVAPSGAGYRLFAAVRTTGLAGTLIGSVDQVINEDAPLITANATIVISGNNAIVQVTGVGALTIEWSATMEVTFAS